MAKPSYNKNPNAGKKGFSYPVFLTGWTLINNSASKIYVQIFNSLAANVTVGTTAPDMVLMVAANSTLAQSFPDSSQLHFNIGFTWCATTDDSGSTAITYGGSEQFEANFYVN